MSTHKSWHSRGYLPHFDVPGLMQFITFRLADALPGEVLRRLMQEEIDDVSRHKQIEQFLDAGHGACWLKQPGVADIVENTLLAWRWSTLSFAGMVCDAESHTCID